MSIFAQNPVVRCVAIETKNSKFENFHSIDWSTKNCKTQKMSKPKNVATKKTKSYKRKRI